MKRTIISLNERASWKEFSRKKMNVPSGIHILSLSFICAVPRVKSRVFSTLASTLPLLSNPAPFYHRCLWCHLCHLSPREKWELLCSFAARIMGVRVLRIFCLEKIWGKDDYDSAASQCKLPQEMTQCSSQMG